MADLHIVQVEKLVKVYPGGTRAVDGIDFEVSTGEFFGFLGPNGAGKSTTMKILSTLLKKTSGKVMVAGHDVERNPTAIRKSIGFAMQEVGLDDLATGRDFLTTQGVLYGLSFKEAQRRAHELLELVGLTGVAERRVGTYSGGMRRRIDLVAALMHRPTLLFLDEPTSGLDPQSRLAIWGHLTELNKQGITIFLTTQIMEEADRLCRRVAIIDHGKIVTQGSPRTLKEELGGDVVTVAVASTDGEDSALVERAVALLRERSYVSDVKASGDRLTITVRDGSEAVPDLVSVLSQNRLRVKNLLVSSPTLDDVFLKHTGHKIRTEDTSADESGQVLRPWLGLKRR
jgi:daunorubicin resistance ABC transporter ATP-binding subunit